MEKMNLNDLKKAWENLSKTVDLSPIRTEKQYKKMVQLADMLSDVVASSKKHALLDLFELVSELIRAYEYEHFRAPDA
jgi:HTH-type transcriptional regulator/antitoxin HigA